MGGINYHTLHFSKWKYSVGEGENSERKSIAPDLPPYPDIKIPLTVGAGLTLAREF